MSSTSRDDQVAKLREIDTSLAAELEVIDSQTRAANKPAEEAASPAPSGGGRHGGGRHGGMGGMGGGGMGGSSGMGGPGGGGHHKRGGGAGAGSGAPSNAAMVSRLVDERTADVKDALERAFALLDPAQQVGAKKVLTDHDVDVDINVGPPALPPPSQTGQTNGEADPPPEP